jgi:hypothetical protein
VLTGSGCFKRPFSYLEHDRQPLLDRLDDAGGHLRCGVPVVSAHSAASLLAPAAGLVSHPLWQTGNRQPVGCSMSACSNLGSVIVV